MANYFLESSAFAKRYKDEQGKEFVDSLFVGDNNLFYLNLSLVEILKTLYRLHKWPQIEHGDIPITLEEFETLKSKLREDLAGMKEVVVTSEMILRTEDILQRAWVGTAFDVLILSSYLVTCDVYHDLVLVSSDHQLNAAALSFVPSGQVVNPEDYR